MAEVYCFQRFAETSNTDRDNQEIDIGCQDKNEIPIKNNMLNDLD